jgi:GT2 family glycosyltransferase
MSDPTVHVIIINWNGCEDTLKCLASIAASSYERTRILVVDNGSTDGSVERIRAEYPEAEILELGGNAGFAGGCNAAFRRLKGEGEGYYFLLNNDAVLESDAIGMLAAAAESTPEAGVWGAKVLFADDPLQIESAGAEVNLRTGRIRQVGFGEKDAGQYSEVRGCDAVNGCAMLIRPEALEAAGVFDEEFFCYFEEVDFCLRAADKGYRVLYCPDAVVYHKGAASGGGRRSPLQLYYGVRNQLLLLSKRGGGGIPGFLRTLYIMLLNVASAVISPGRSRLSALKWIWRGWRDYRQGKFGKARHEFR